VSQAIRDVAALLQRETGIVTRDQQLPGLEAALGRIEPGMDAERFLSEVAARGRAPRLLGRLIDEVTIKETYFLRDRRELDAIDWPRLLGGARASGSDVVRIWVAACATGEECYSLALMCSEALGPGKVSVLGTDISAAALRRAEQGRYSERAVRHVDPEGRERHFTRDGRHYVVRERIRGLVRLRRHNLFREAAPPPGEVPFDLITCRNVLIYFDPPAVASIIARLEGALRPSGQLLLGVADRLVDTSDRLGRGARTRRADRRREPRPPRPALRRPLGLPATEAGSGSSASVPARSADRPRRRREDMLEDALQAADAGDIGAAMAKVSEILDRDPLDADAYFVQGLAELAGGDAPAAVMALRRALYVDPTFAIAAFELGRALDSAGDRRGARRAYEQALRMLDPDDDRHRAVLGDVEFGDVAAACRTRLRASAR